MLLALALLRVYVEAGRRLNAGARVEAPERVEGLHGRLKLPIRIVGWRGPWRPLASLDPGPSFSPPPGWQDLAEGGIDVDVSVGVHRVAGIRLAVRDPMGAFTASWIVDMDLTVVARPRPARVRVHAADKAPRWGSAAVAAVRGPPDPLDYRWIRGYEPGDDPRLIDWKAAARAGELMVREPERGYDPSRIAVVADISIESFVGRPGSLGVDAVLDALASLLASLDPGAPPPRVALYTGSSCRLIGESTSWSALRRLQSEAPSAAAASTQFDPSSHAVCVEKASSRADAVVLLEPPGGLLDLDYWRLTRMGIPGLALVRVETPGVPAPREELEEARYRAPRAVVAGAPPSLVASLIAGGRLWR